MIIVKQIGLCTLHDRFTVLHYVFILLLSISEFIVCWEKPFGGDSRGREANQLICIANQLIGLYMMQIVAEMYFQKSFSFCVFTFVK